MAVEIVSMHNHTSYVGHAEDDVFTMARAAAAAGVSALGFTEHFPLRPPFDENGQESMLEGAVDAYCADVAAARDLHPGMDIVCGCELDWLGAQENRDLAHAGLERFTFVYASVHFVDGLAIDNPDDMAFWEEMGPDAAWRRYFQLFCDAATSSLPIDAMAHPDLVKKFGIYPSFDPQPLYDEAAQAVLAGGRMVELNTSGWHYPCKEAYPAPALLRTFCRAGIPCTVGCDAHRAAHVARDVDAAYRAMYDAGYREVAVPTSEGGMRAFPIE